MTALHRISRPILFAFGAATIFAAPLRAQDSALVAPASSPVVTTAPQAAPAPTGPTLESASVAVKNVAVETNVAPASPGKYYDQGTKLMIVGGAAILTGIVVGGDAGHAISIVGAVVGLYGLYKYLE